MAGASAAASAEAGDLGRRVRAEDGPARVLARLHGRAAGAPGAAPGGPGRRRRGAVVEWLVRFFERQRMRDSWLMAAVSLLDRVYTSRGPSELRSAPSNKLSADDVAEALSCALIALKLSPAEAEFDCCMKDLILLDSAPKDMWDRIRRHEGIILNLLDFKVAVPNSHDLGQQLALELQLEAEAEGPDWPGLRPGLLPAPRSRLMVPEPRIAILITYLNELAVVHMPADAHSSIVSATLMALAVTQLALHAFPEPPPQRCIDHLKSAQQLLREEEAVQLPGTLQVLHKLWATSLPDSPVVKKWARRAATLGGPLPGPPPVLLHGPTDLPDPTTPQCRRYPARHSSSTPQTQAKEPLTHCAMRGAPAGLPVGQEEAVAPAAQKGSAEAEPRRAEPPGAPAGAREEPRPEAGCAAGPEAPPAAGGPPPEPLRAPPSPEPGAAAPQPPEEGPRAPGGRSPGGRSPAAAAPAAAAPGAAAPDAGPGAAGRPAGAAGRGARARAPAAYSPIMTRLRAKRLQEAQGGRPAPSGPGAESAKRRQRARPEPPQPRRRGGR